MGTCVAQQLTVKMGKNKNKKQNEAGNDSGAKKDNPTEPLTNFVPIVSCFYCDVVSFDVNDQENYGGHLKKAHNINKNTEALVDVTLKLQSDLKTSTKNVDGEESQKGIQENPANLSKTESKTDLATDTKPESASIPVADLHDARLKEDHPPTTDISIPKSAFAGLPIDDSADAWMDDDVGPIMDDEEESEEEKPSSVPTPAPIPKEEAALQQPKSAFAGLPIDDAVDAWMNDDVGPIMDSDEEEEDEEPKEKEKPVSPKINVPKIQEDQPTKSNSNKPKIKIEKPKRKDKAPKKQAEEILKQSDISVKPEKEKEVTPIETISVKSKSVPKPETKGPLMET